ncbi:hypothetical protein [Ancylobacter sp. FA202]|uniref:hypothetical protein n=1 Tax=Ancylobacter sp. FA202 TaxID=1111106 RepID=UPI0003706891|nr:hypothetical protein [Ancylobacter sp. FA202]
MRQVGGMVWLGWLIAGPTAWAGAFSVAYGLHGLGCELGWPALDVGPLSLQRMAIALPSLAAILLCLVLLSRVKATLGPEAGLPRLGLWIGLIATLYTMAPVLVATSC